MPVGEGQADLHAFCPPDWDAEASRLAVELVRLVLRLEHEFTDVGDGGSFLSFQPPAVVLQDSQGDLEGGRDVLFVDRVSTAQVAVGSAEESGPRSDVLMKGDPNRLIDKDAELGQEPVQWRGIPSDREDKGRWTSMRCSKQETGLRIPERDARK